jgi:hypothetical protein
VIVCRGATSISTSTNTTPLSRRVKTDVVAEPFPPLCPVRFPALGVLASACMESSPNSDACPCSSSFENGVGNSADPLPENRTNRRSPTSPSTVPESRRGENVAAWLSCGPPSGQGVVHPGPRIAQLTPRGVGDSGSRRGPEIVVFKSPNLHWHRFRVPGVELEPPEV